MLAMMSFNLVDTWFVAQLGADQLAAMSFTFPVVMLLLSVGIGMMAGTSSVLARVVGRGDQHRVRRLASDALILSLVLSLIGTVIGLATIDPLFRLLGASDELLPLIRDYMWIWYAGYFSILVSMVGLGAVRSVGEAKLQSNTMIAAALINLILDPLLIFGLLGFPRLELQGAAVATIVARLLVLPVGYWALRYKLNMLSFSFPGWQVLMDSWRGVLHVGGPAIGTNMIIPLTTGVVVAMVAGFGADAVAGFGAATRIGSLVIIAFLSMSAVIGPVVGQNFGAGQHPRILAAMKDCAVFCIGLGLILAVILALTADQILHLFSAEAPVVEVGVAYLLIVPLGQGAQGVVMVTNAAFNGIGRPLPAVAISCLRVIVFYLPVAYLASQAFGVKGIFAAHCLANLICGALAYWWFRRVCHANIPKSTA